MTSAAPVPLRLSQEKADKLIHGPREKILDLPGGTLFRCLDHDFQHTALFVAQTEHDSVRRASCLALLTVLRGIHRPLPVLQDFSARLGVIFIVAPDDEQRRMLIQAYSDV